MAGGRPTHKVTVPVEFLIGPNQKKTKWYEVGSAWQNQNGSISFSIVTIPGVKFVLFPAEKQVVADRDIQLGGE